MGLYDEGTAMMKKVAAQKRKSSRSRKLGDLEKFPRVTPDKPGSVPRTVMPVPHKTVPRTTMPISDNLEHMPHVVPDKPGAKPPVLKTVKARETFSKKPGSHVRYFKDTGAMLPDQAARERYWASRRTAPQNNEFKAATAAKANSTATRAAADQLLKAKKNAG